MGQAPHPVVVSTRLKNVTPTGIWGWDNRWTLSYHPSTWYFDDDATATQSPPRFRYAESPGSGREDCAVATARDEAVA